MGRFLHQFTGFTPDYLADTVQTIFLDGTAVDDLQLPFMGSTPTLALSGAMPGLAGAIFRKNSFHSALRTDTKSLHSDSNQNESITVTLKLFNRIAKERGEELLSQGVTMRGSQILSFFNRRPNLLQYILQIHSSEELLKTEDFLNLLSKSEIFNLKITGDNDRND